MTSINRDYEIPELRYRLRTLKSNRPESTKYVYTCSQEETARRHAADWSTQGRTVLIELWDGPDYVSTIARYVAGSDAG